jgi:hypothetical protein
MKIGSTRRFTAAAVLGIICIAGAAIAANQAPPAQNTGDRVPLSEEVFKQITLLRGIPVDTFFEAMGMFANAMGNDCTFCHEPRAYYDKSLFAQQTPKMERAREMIQMTNALNKQYFRGAQRVTCFTCHGGDNAPKSDPNFNVQYGTPELDPNIRDFPTDERLKPELIFAKYIEALGGADRLAKFTSFVAKGNYSGFDTAFDKVPVEIFGAAPGQQTMIAHTTIGNATRTFDGKNGWVAGPDSPMPVVTLTDGNLDRARLEAMLAFPTADGLRKAFPLWRCGMTEIDGETVTVVQGIAERQRLVNLYFDDDGLLVRFIRWTPTPVGFVPTMTDYSDYREVDGVKVPFKRVISQTYMQMDIELESVEANARIDPKIFAKPAPVSPPAP